MVKNLEAAKRYCEPTIFEQQLLSSQHRPVVLIKKKDVPVNETISPGLSNIGVFLPYSAMHHLMFHSLEEDALVMTSANMPGEPMVLTEKDALDLKADVYLLHNRRIINRCDDSVLRAFGDRTFFLRKSRGHIPSYMDVGMEGNVIGLGGQENLCGAVTNDGRLYPTQYIGDGDSPNVIDFLSSSISYLRNMLDIRRIDTVCIDLHPRYTNRGLGKEMAENENAELMENPASLGSCSCPNGRCGSR